MLTTRYIRDGKNQIIGSTTSGLPGGTTVARDSEGQIIGYSCDLFGNTRDRDGSLVSRNVSDASLLFDRKRK